MNIKIKKEPKYKVIKTEVPIDETKTILKKKNPKLLI